ncbi:MAG: TfoX/Sxy family protein [Burkholderiales bacterium]|jgi:DNA transformation protein|nr:TfoX/Sxy family protein [Burkholderiales bacterium]
MSDIESLAKLPGLGPNSVALLCKVGINDAAQLRDIGAVAAYVAVLSSGQKTSLNLLWALEGALTQRSWQQVARQDRLRLLLAVDDLMHALHTSPP